jgi:hypothetical protein
MMCRKQKGLAMNGENPVKIYVAETKIVSLSSDFQCHEKKGAKNGAKLD